MITRNKNRAAVILWSIGNETPQSPPRLKFLSALAQTAHRLDLSRLVTAALQTSYLSPTTITVNDPLSQYLGSTSDEPHQAMIRPGRFQNNSQPTDSSLMRS